MKNTLILRTRYFLSWWWDEVLGKKTTGEIYDRVSAHGVYDFTVGFAERVRRLEKIYRTLPVTPKKILDLACGTGANIEAYPWKKTANILGVDVSASMLSFARERFAGRKNIVLQRQNFFDLAKTRERYDLISITYATRFVPMEKEKDFVRLISALLRRGGYFVVVNAEEPWPVWLGRLMSRIHVPRGYNSRMNYSAYLKFLLADVFTLRDEITLDSAFLGFLRQKGLIFRKP